MVLAYTGTDPTAEEDLAFHLGDNPQTHPNWTEPSYRATGLHRLPTFRSSYRPIWLPSRGRALSMDERLAALGFPVSEDLACCLGLSGRFHCPWGMRGLIGNTMHLANIGVFQACAAAAGSFAP